MGGPARRDRAAPPDAPHAPGGALGVPGGDQRRALIELVRPGGRTSQRGSSRRCCSPAGGHGRVRLEACAAAAGAFPEVPWTPELQPLRQRLEAESAAGPAFRPPGLPTRPSLALPSPSWGATRAPPGRSGDPSGRRRRLLQLDPRYCGAASPPARRGALRPLAESEFRRGRGAAEPTGPSSLDDPTDGWAPSGCDRAAQPPRADGDGSGRPPRRGPGPLLGERPRTTGCRQPGRHPRRGVPGCGGPAPGGFAGGDRGARAPPQPRVGGHPGPARRDGGASRHGRPESPRLARSRWSSVAGVTHELNTPARAIRSPARNWRRIVTDPARARYGASSRRRGRPSHRPRAQV